MEAQRTDMIYWRIVPVGFATVSLSALLLVGLLRVTTGANTGNVIFASDLVLASATGMFAVVVFGGVVWLPAMVVWNLVVGRLRRSVGLRAAAVRTSLGLAGLICAVMSFLVWDKGISAFVLSVLWTFGTAFMAGLLTAVAFRESRVEGMV